MSLFALFDIGTSALIANQTALGVTSNNIANVNTPGYSRQDIILDVATPVQVQGGYLGRGVAVAGIKRNYDRFIEAQLLGQHQAYGRSYALDQTLSEVEQVFNDADGLGLATPLSEFFNAWNEVATNPEGTTQRQALFQKAQSLSVAAQGMEQSILDTMSNTNDAVKDAAATINDLAERIAALNGKIVQTEAGTNTQNANELRTERDQAVSQLSDMVDFSTYEDANGALTVTVGMRALVSGETANQLSATMNQDGGMDLILNGINITQDVHGGQIGGYLAVRSEIESGALTGLRKLMASLTKEVNLLHQSGFGLDGSTGNDFFNPLQLTTKDFSAGANITASITDLAQITLDEYDIRFDAGGNYLVTSKQTGALVASGAYVSGNPVTVNGITFTITGAVSVADRFTISPLESATSNMGLAISDPRQVAAASVPAELPGNNVNALAIANMADTAVANLGNTTFSSFYQGVVGSVGTMSKAASDSVTFENNLLSELTDQRDSVSGVSLDEEAANLLKYQRSYEAGAKMIKVADELLQTVLNL